MDRNEKLTLIKEIFGKKCESYLKNKHQGGSNNEKGSEYERSFAVCRMAELSKSYLEKNRDYLIDRQTLDFVDDLVIKDVQSNAREHYQMKNTPSVSWGNKDKQGSIVNDFIFQKTLNDKLDIQSTLLFLVIAHDQTSSKLKQCFPEEIKKFSHVLCFPSSVVKQILKQCPVYKEAFAWLSPFEDKKEALFRVLTGAYLASPVPFTLSSLIKKIKEEYPDYIRDSGSQEIKKDFIMILDALRKSLPGFGYDIDASKGFFRWYFVTDMFEDAGNMYRCSSKEFVNFQNRIIENKPATFEQFEDIR